ncbi:hypothetical protein JKG47_02890 [Acidithiobacillus sp. MC6.1]|nr:hypothetical protein [Acidithiobacillus sp. MC6.1]
MKRWIAEQARAIRESFSTAWMMQEPVARVLFPMQRKRFYRRIQIMSKAQLPFSDAVEELRNRAKESKNGVMYAALSSMAYRQGRGRSIAESLDGWVPREEMMLLNAGDKRGYSGFVTAIDQILNMGSATKAMMTTLVSGLIEPLIMIAAMYGLITWMAKSFNQKALSLTHINPNQLTGEAHQLYAVGVFATTVWSWLIPLLVLLFMGVLLVILPVWVKPEWLRKIADHVPPFSIYKAITGARWMMAFATLGKAGIPYEEIFNETKNMSKPWLRIRLAMIEHLYRRGIGMGPAFAKSGYQFPSKSLVDDLLAFGDRPGFEDVLLILAEEWVKSTTQTVKGITFALTGVGYLSVFGGMIWIMGSFNAMQSQIMAIIQQVH